MRHLEVLGLDWRSLTVMKEGVLSPVGGANGGFGHMIDDERQRRKVSNKVQLEVKMFHLKKKHLCRHSSRLLLT